MRTHYKYSDDALRMIEEELRLVLYAVANADPNPDLDILAHRTTMVRLTRELLEDVQAELALRP